jgi:predicted porin
MKKSLLAIAVASALPGFAQAQSSLTMYGVVDASAQWSNQAFNSSVSYNSTTKQLGVGRGAAGWSLANGVAMGSRFGIRGSEDLGGGLKAIFTLEHRFDVTDGDISGGASTGQSRVAGAVSSDSSTNGVKFWNGQAWVGVSSSQWGQVTAGRQYTPIFWALYPADFTAYQYYNNWSGPTGSTLATVIPQGPVRANDSVAYKSPTFGGLTVYAMYAFGERLPNGSSEALADTTSIKKIGTGDIYGIAAGWQLGGLYIGGGYHGIDNNATAANGSALVGNVPTVGTSVGAITASYKWESFGVSVGYTQVNFQQFYNNTTNSANVNNILLSAFANVGTGRVLFNYYNTNNHDFKSSYLVGTSTIPAAINNNSTNSFGLTYEYPLSKRTAMYVSGGMSDFSNFQPSGTTPIKPSAVALGLRHMF